MGFLGEFLNKLLLSVAVTCFTIGGTLLHQEEYELGITLIVLGIVLILVIALVDSIWKETLEKEIKTLKREMECV